MATGPALVRTRYRVFGAALLAAAVSTLALSAQTAPPARLSDQEFWKVVTDLSEGNGTFQSDNLLSNESRLQYIIPALEQNVKPGGTYLGVGPEQNFTLIAAMKPSMAFIVDIRRGNLDLHLLYKALFELSTDRVDFVARLFSRARPRDLKTRATAAEIFSAFVQADPSESLYNENLKTIESLLMTKHGFALSTEDLKGLEYVYNAFFSYGPTIQYSSSDGFGGRGEPTYIDLMLATDAAGKQHGFLTSDEAFLFLKEMEARNAIVPLVGDFAGAKALRGVGNYVREHGGLVRAFYVSNVEQYLRLFRTWQNFCANARTLPADDDTTFIRAGRGGRVARGNTMTLELAPLASEVEYCGPNRF
jgi:hypothetical protein